MKRRTKWVWAILVLLVVLPAVPVSTAFFRAERSLEEHRRECETILALPQPGGRTRPAIFEPEETGSSWDFEGGLLWNDLTGAVIRQSFRSLNAVMVEVDRGLHHIPLGGVEVSRRFDGT